MISSLLIASSIPAIKNPLLITSGLFRIISMVLLYRKNFAHFKISGGFIFGHFFLAEIKIVWNFLQVM